MGPRSTVSPLGSLLEDLRVEGVRNPTPARPTSARLGSAAIRRVLRAHRSPISVLESGVVSGGRAHPSRSVAVGHRARGSRRLPGRGHRGAAADARRSAVAGRRSEGLLCTGHGAAPAARASRPASSGRTHRRTTDRVRDSSDDSGAGRDAPRDQAGRRDRTRAAGPCRRRPRRGRTRRRGRRACRAGSWAA